MQDIIQLLPDHIANQIAAGEVIQRPASVVKELMENAIDAGATRIDVVIKDAGKALIQVVDNGKGMSKGDAQLCFARHATSKIVKADDLFALHTKGFRGEALASIAAIAHVRLLTKPADQTTGFELINEGSKIDSIEEVVCANGTSFEIKNLFYNVPARRNFLKSAEVEFRHIREEFERIVLAHPDIHFTLAHNGGEIYNLPSVVLRKRVVDIIGDRQNERLVPIHEETEIVRISGYVIKPEFAKKSRGEQYFFVNNRFFKDGYFNHAINKAFDGLISPKHYPGYFLYFEIDPSKIDVNVHPTKTEIKFEEDRLIYAILVSSIRQALGKYNVAPTLDFEQETSFDIPSSMRSQIPVEPQIKIDPTYNPFESATQRSTSSSSSSGSRTDRTAAISNFGFGQQDASKADWENFYAIEEEDESESQQQLFDDSTPEQLDQYVFKSPYLLTPSKSGFMAIHVRRAHERIIYDELMKQFILKPIDSQTMLFPFEKELSTGERTIWLEHQAMIERLGFQVSFEANQMHVSGVPNMLQEEMIDPCIDSILQTMQYQDIDKGDVAHVLINAIAKNASKRNNIITNKESVQHLVEQLFQCPEHMHTADGKTILSTLLLDELTAKF